MRGICAEVVLRDSKLAVNDVFSWRESGSVWGLIVVVAGVLALAFAAEASGLILAWQTQEEYSHGILIPFIALFLIYQKKDQLEKIPFSGSWAGVAIVAFGALLHLAGRLAVVSTMGQYALVICITGLFLAFMGWRAFKMIWVAMFMLIFMVKLPTFFYNNLSSQLQLISSQIGVWAIRLFDISVYLEGNVIDLGSMKLQVVEACSGLRYLFPLMALSLILAIFYKAPIWARVLVFLSSIPVTVLMNSFRIGAIGVTVEYWGKQMAEGFLHDFEGWVVFMAAFFVLFLEVLVINRLLGEKRPLQEVLSLELPARSDPDVPRRVRKVPVQFYIATAILLTFMLVNESMSVSESVYPAREKLKGFPTVIDDRLATPGVLDPIYLDELQLDDYMMADYKSASRSAINLYIAYYDVQAEGAGTIHSPRSCLPGSGWQIKTIEQKDLPDIRISGQPLQVSRAVISKGSQQVLVYYWMQQRGRIITNEIMAKWWIFWDRLGQGRSDGALVRVMMDVGQFQDVAVAEQQMQQFIGAMAPDLPRFIPD